MENDLLEMFEKLRPNEGIQGRNPPTDVYCVRLTAADREEIMDALVRAYALKKSRFGHNGPWQEPKWRLDP